MGWWYTRGASKKDVIADLTKTFATANGGESVCLAHKCAGNCLWYVRKDPSGTWIGLSLLGSSKDCGWGSKDMDEGMHPYYYSCPLKYLELAPVKCEKWREGVRAYHAKRAHKLKVGSRVKLAAGCKINGKVVEELTITSVKPLLAQWNGWDIRVRRRHIEAVLS